MCFILCLSKRHIISGYPISSDFSDALRLVVVLMILISTNDCCLNLFHGVGGFYRYCPLPQFTYSFCIQCLTWLSYDYKTKSEHCSYTAIHNCVQNRDRYITCKSKYSKLNLYFYFFTNYTLKIICQNLNFHKTL